MWAITAALIGGLIGGVCGLLVCGFIGLIIDFIEG